MVLFISVVRFSRKNGPVCVNVLLVWVRIKIIVFVCQLRYFVLEFPPVCLFVFTFFVRWFPVSNWVAVYFKCDCVVVTHAR